MDTLAPYPRKLNSDLSWQINISIDQNSGPGLFIIWLKVWAEQQDKTSPPQSAVSGNSPAENT